MDIRIEAFYPVSLWYLHRCSASQLSKHSGESPIGFELESHEKTSQLAKKFLLLYKLRINSSINTNTDLAKLLGVSKQFISKDRKSVV